MDSEQADQVAPCPYPTSCEHNINQESACLQPPDTEQHSIGVMFVSLFLALFLSPPTHEKNVLILSGIMFNNLS